MAIIETPSKYLRVSNDRPSQSCRVRPEVGITQKDRINVKIVGHAQYVHVAFPSVLPVFQCTGNKSAILLFLHDYYPFKTLVHLVLDSSTLVKYPPIWQYSVQ